jgi:hypothetical protein
MSHKIDFYRNEDIGPHKTVISYWCKLWLLQVFFDKKLLSMIIYGNVLKSKMYLD